MKLDFEDEHYREVLEFAWDIVQPTHGDGPLASHVVFPNTNRGCVSVHQFGFK
jgi:hypothetical protein